MNMPRIILGCFLLASLLPSIARAVDQEPGPAADEKSAAPAIPESKPLKQTIKLEFKAENADSAQSFTVLCAESEYRFHYNVSKADYEQHVDISGTLRETDDGRLLLTFKSALTFNRNGEGTSGTLSTAGSAWLVPGKPKRLMAMSTYTIQVAATREE